MVAAKMPRAMHRARPDPLALWAPGPWGLALAAALALLALAGLQQASRLPSAAALACAAAAVAPVGLLLGRWSRAAAWALCALAWVLAVLAWGSWRAQLRLEPALPVAWEGRELRFDAEVTALPQAQDGMAGQTLWRLTVRALNGAQDADGAQVPLPDGLSLWFEPHGPDRPYAGERWRFHARLKRVHASQNPDLPDAERWLLERGIGAQGSVLKARAHRLAQAPWWSVQAAREALRQQLYERVSAPRERAVLGGLLIGDQAAMAGADWALLRDTGVVHLFSISGLHITGFAWLAVQLIGALWRRFPRWCERLPAPLAARWGGVLLASGYALLAGWGVPAQRTVALLVLVALLRTSGRLWPWPLALLVCAVPIALADPWAVVQPGFWLSFAAVALLMQQGHGSEQQGERRPARELLRTQATATLGLAPLLVLFFGQVSLVGVAANLVAVPVVTLLLTPLALLGTLLPPLWAWAALGADALFALLKWLAAWPWAVWSLPTAPLVWQVLAMLGLLLAVLRLPRWLRLAGGLLALALFLWQPARPAAGAFTLRVFDVGQGSAVWLQTATHDMVYDAGPRWGPGGGQDAGARVLLPSLRAAGVRRLDALVLSHGDADHVGGAASLHAGLPVAQVIAPRDPRLASWRAAPCRAGLGWVWDGVRFDLLHPIGEQEIAGNANGCVLRVQAQNGRSVLLAADIGAAQERALLQHTQLAPVTLLLLPHHGSASSSSPDFLAALRPQLAFAQAGYRSRHGHPALAVQTRLRVMGIPLLTSAACGAFDWHSAHAPGPQGCWRLRAPRYWHAVPALNGPQSEGFEGPPEAP